MWHEPKHTVPGKSCKEIIEYISTLPTVLEKQYDLNENKFCRLEEVSEKSKIQKLLFKSATHKYRAPLMNKDSGAERNNPKKINEGERVKTHLTIKYNSNDVIICLESGFGTLQIKQFINYLNSFLSDYTILKGTQRDYSFNFEVIVKDNFLEELKKMNRVMEGEIYIDKSVLGSEALNYSDRTTTVKHDLKMVIKAERGFSIIGALTDIFNKLNSGKSTINKIRVRGKNENDNNIIIDSEFISKMEFVPITLHEETGEVNTELIFEQLIVIALTL